MEENRNYSKCSANYIGMHEKRALIRVSVQGVKSHGGHFECLCRGFEFYEVKKKFLLFFKKKMEILLHFQSFL